MMLALANSFEQTCLPAVARPLMVTPMRVCRPPGSETTSVISASIREWAGVGEQSCCSAESYASGYDFA
jgi:hypothetical protein